MSPQHSCIQILQTQKKLEIANKVTETLKRSGDKKAECREKLLYLR